MKERLKKAYRSAYSLLGHRGLGSLPGVRRINNFVVEKIKTDKKKIEVDGNTMMLLEKDSAISNALPILGKVEPLTTDLFESIVKKGDTVLDLGANIGYFTLLFAKKVGPSGKVFAFEVDPRNIGILKENIKLNGYGNVTVSEKAVSDKSGSATLHLTRTSDSNSIYEVEEGLPTIEVKTISLDEYFKDKEMKVDVVKMDIQGAEYAALLGMEEIINKNPKIKIICEFEPILLKKAGITPEEFLNLISGMGFEIYIINEKKRKVEKATISQLVEKYNKKGENTNLFCVKN